VTRKPAPPRRPRVVTTAKATRWEVVLPFHPTRLNVLMRMHWSRRGRTAADEALVIGWSCNLAGVPPAKGKRRVSMRLTLAGRDKRSDPDARWKTTLDGLVKAGRLVDDSARWVELGPVEFERGAERKTTLFIEDVG
jgi:hypothetical protein